MILPSGITEDLMARPETGMGFQKVTFTMKDGSNKTVYVYNGTYVYNEIDIEQIQSVHEVVGE
jgi:hypothetical protein